MKAVQGNWRNALYLHCGCFPCPYGNKQSCEGYLLAFDAHAAPILLPIDQFRIISGEVVDPRECHGAWNLKSFETVYSQYLLWKTTGGNQCPAKELSRQH